MKLYRGLKATEFLELTPEAEAKMKATWRRLLARRAKSDFSYPVDMNPAVLETSRLIRLRRQYFTDNRTVAASYAKSNNGVLLEIEPSTKDVLACFDLEFQNFAHRRTSFEIVYVIDAVLLLHHKKKWRMKVNRL